MLAILGVSFLTPYDALFVLAGALPLAALLASQRRAAEVRRLLGAVVSPRRAAVPAVAALVLLPALVAVAAAQPVVVRTRMVSERADAQAFVLFDTSTSMRASAAPGPLPSVRYLRLRRFPFRFHHNLLITERGKAGDGPGHHARAAGPLDGRAAGARRAIPPDGPRLGAAAEGHAIRHG